MKKWKLLNKTIVKGPGKSNEIIAILLNNRGIKTEKQKKDFFDPKLETITAVKAGIDKKELGKTQKRIRQAIKKNEKIVIYGDYDVDGISGTAILWETIYGIYENVIPYIPHRTEEGYGLSVKGIDNILKAEKKVGLIITVDNGIVANDAIDYALKKGIDVIVTDHHVKATRKPKAFSIVHTTTLCGAGVAYLLSREISDKTPDSHLELVALATVADLVPLTGANRVLLQHGLSCLRRTKRPGLLALFAEGGIVKEEIDVYKIGHVIAPRLNAAGRVAHALDSLRLICTKDIIRARKLAAHLGETNSNRKTLTEDLTMHAASIGEQINPLEKLIFVHHEDYNQGVIGLMASRLVDAYYLPAIVVSVGKEYSKGSARSVPGFNIIEFIRSFSPMLVDAGGHPMAAGFTIETAKIEEFKNKLMEKAKDLIKDSILQRWLSIDMNLSFPQVSAGLYREIQKMSPFGMGNTEPVFVTYGAEIIGMKEVGREKNHLKLMLSDEGVNLEAMLFGSKEKDKFKAGDRVDIAYSIDLNIWNGTERVQLKIKDIKLTE